MGRKERIINLPAPYLKRVALDQRLVSNPNVYPFCLPLFKNGFSFDFKRAITIIVGENGTGKSTLLEGIAVLAGFDEAGGAKGYRPVDHSRAIEASGGRLADALRASWLPKLSNGWFFRAESFFPVARYLDEAAVEVHEVPPDFLSHSHGEGFLRLFAERCRRQGLYIFDEPESALSPSRQIELLKIFLQISESKICQVVMATHSPVLMACPGAHLLQLSKSGLTETTLYETEHFRLMREFCADPTAFIADKLDTA
jgi:predicted ATPase